MIVTKYMTSKIMLCSLPITFVFLSQATGKSAVVGKPGFTLHMPGNSPFEGRFSYKNEPDDTFSVEPSKDGSVQVESSFFISNADTMVGTVNVILKTT